MLAVELQAVAIACQHRLNGWERGFGTVLPAKGGSERWEEAVRAGSGRG